MTTTNTRCAAPGAARLTGLILRFSLVVPMLGWIIILTRLFGVHRPS